MQQTRPTQQESALTAPAIPYGSHEVRLSGRQWLAAAALILGVLVFAPVAWERIEEFEPGADYRMPYALSGDYWLFDRYCRFAASRCDTLVLGDSVIWGQYVRPDQTLTHHLNDLAGRSRFGNMGVDGLHPAALAGLIDYYGRAISGKNVLLHCNVLWMSSTRHDLQTDKEFHFNHPRLVPQFVPSIPCYRESYADRLGILVERTVPFLAWANHLRLVYFDGKSVPAWTLEHPYGNPAKGIGRGLPAPEGSARQEPVPWTDRGVARQSFPWVPLDASFQWRSFRRALAMLRGRGSRVFVLVGPFNEHMLEQESLQTYAARKAEIAAWLREQQVAHYVPPALPSRYCADASHPLDEGYAMLAAQLFECDSFIEFLDLASTQ